METKVVGHTPGPWDAACSYAAGKQHGHSRKYNCVYTHQKSEQGERIVSVADKIENYEDARLIAAAPDLLAALEASSDELADLSGLLKDKHALVLNIVRGRIDDAIAKAKGGQ